MPTRPRRSAKSPRAERIASGSLDTFVSRMILRFANDLAVGVDDANAGLFQRDIESGKQIHHGALLVGTVPRPPHKALDRSTAMSGGVSRPDYESPS
jgi:hypothetical protein